MNPMMGLYVRDAAKVDEETIDLVGVWPEAAELDRRVLAESSPVISFPYSRQRIGSSLAPVPPGTFGRIFVSPSLRLFVNPWAVAFLEHLNRSLSEGGLIAVPVVPPAEAEKRGHWSVDRLEKLFGSPARRVGGFAVFERTGTFTRRDSVLAWYLSSQYALTIDEVLLRGGALGSVDERTLSDLYGAGGSSSPSSDPALGGDRGPEVGDFREGESHDARSLVGGAFHVQRYWFTGLSYKSALVAHILRARLGKTEGASIVDLGGGPGWLSCELLLDESLNLARATNVEQSTDYQLLAWRMLQSLRDRLTGRYSFARSTIEEWPFDETYDAVIGIGSLLYVPRDLFPGVIERAWEALNPGGVIIIHENIRAPSYTRDFNLMFEPDELDGVLEKFGPVDYYLPTATVQIPAGDAGRRSVFRVVQKES